MALFSAKHRIYDFGILLFLDLENIRWFSFWKRGGTIDDFSAGELESSPSQRHNILAHSTN